MVSQAGAEDGAPRRAGLFARLWPVALTVAIFVVIFLRIPFDRFRDALAEARLLPFLGVMATFSLCFFLMDTFVLSRMIRWFHGPLGYRELLPVRASTYVVSIVNTQLAQGALGLYIHRRFLTPLGEIFSTVAMMILLEVTQLILLATFGMLTFPREVPRGLFLVPVVLASFWTLLWLFAHGRIGGSGDLVLRLRGNVLLQTFRRASLAQALAVLGLKASITLLSLFVHKAALGFFGIDIPLLRLLAFLPIVFMIGALPVTVAHLGTSQAAWIFFFNDYAGEADLLAYSLASHLTFMLANGTLGLLFLPKAYADLFVHRRQEDIRAR
ncbi:MAG: hypothetical protein ACREQY_24405 [Candidatus Binatia bacterium]